MVGYLFPSQAKLYAKFPASSRYMPVEVIEITNEGTAVVLCVLLSIHFPFHALEGPQPVKTDRDAIMMSDIPRAFSIVFPQ